MIFDGWPRFRGAFCSAESDVTGDVITSGAIVTAGDDMIL
jgi:hypothetical protein